MDPSSRREEERLRLERKRLALEKDRLRIERERLSLERQRANEEQQRHERDALTRLLSDVQAQLANVAPHLAEVRTRSEAILASPPFTAVDEGTGRPYEELAGLVERLVLGIGQQVQAISSFTTVQPSEESRSLLLSWSEELGSAESSTKAVGLCLTIEAHLLQQGDEPALAGHAETLRSWPRRVAAGEVVDDTAMPPDLAAAASAVQGVHATCSQWMAELGKLPRRPRVEGLSAVLAPRLQEAWEAVEVARSIPIRRFSKLALSSFILGLSSLFLLCVTGVPAILTGLGALRRARRAPIRGRGLAVAGIVLGTLGLAFMALLLYLGSTAPPAGPGPGTG